MVSEIIKNHYIQLELINMVINRNWKTAWCFSCR